MRLDKTLIQHGLATSGQIEEALDYQKSHGGRLETHLYRLGYINEANLSRILAEQFGCRSVTLAGVEIPGQVLKLIPPETAWRELVIPFDYDPGRNVVKIACEDPRSKQLADELAEILFGKQVELYLALGVVLKCSIIKHYRDSFAQLSAEEPEAAPETRPESTDTAAGVESTPEGDSSQEFPCWVLIFDETRKSLSALEHTLRHQGFCTIGCDSIEQLVKHYTKSRPDIMLLCKQGQVSEVSQFVAGLALRGVSILLTPTFLISGDIEQDKVGSILKQGIEDVISPENILDLTIIKMNKIRDRLAAEIERRLELIQDLGTHGSLEDMNVVDLLQSMGPTGKTARISITGRGRQLTIFLDKGNIIYAECDDKKGAEAVYEGLAIDRGVWSVEPVNPGELPEPNNFLSNDAILLEGCRLMDEAGRNDSPIELNLP
ncbi:MAG: DUF4388 domain-containing protein [Candidatus Zixiibacteriota bacterium]|nr:MAG: DUF4388 domain-containing protein [candidate division Zixibacteria bacterium]